MYVLWAEVPASSAPSPILHGTNKSVLLSSFTVNDTGGVIGLDLSKAESSVKAASPVNGLRAIFDIELSVERTDSVGTKPSSVFMATTITGTASKGIGTMTETDEEAFDSVAISKVEAFATLGSAVKTQKYDSGEVYLMKATSRTNATGGISPDPLPFQEGNWQYAVWTIDSSHTFPVFTFLGYINSQTANSKDSKSSKDNYPFPGGKSPSDSSTVLLNLTKGRSGVLVNLEPNVLPGDPVKPFDLWILWGHITEGQQIFQPFPLVNIFRGKPSIEVTINR